METLTARGVTAATPAQRNLYQFHGTPDGFNRARLIASSVEQISRDGFRIQPFGDVGKIIVEEAAELIGVPGPTIKQYLKAWNLAAIAGLCVSSGALTPEAGRETLLPDAEFSEFWEQAG